MNQIRPKHKLGKLPRRYIYVDNPYEENNIDSCPKCNCLPKNKKFILFIVSENVPPITLGHTCIFCSDCDLIITHRRTLDEQVRFAYYKIDRNIRIKEYFVMGTYDKSIWEKSLNSKYESQNIYTHLADFESYFVLGMNN